MIFTAKVVIKLRESILDPQGKTVENSLKSIGFSAILETRIGKYIELKIDAENEEDARILIENACVKLLANPVMENYSYSLEKSEKELV
ncbi:MAG TPA: phosphoribosylformylglycinamidine synthase [Bacteroidetes bacterium]|nr:phosphoribosylformylglycinamidine synthase [Bacteroidota bacterium]HCN37815.1 phosphoribosylformylglycinamidine synthase [Bacteroidota bacterium]